MFNIGRGVMLAQSLGYMPPWVAQLVSFVVWGSQSCVACPAHCSASFVLHLAIFLCGFSCGALALVVALWIFGLLSLDFKDHTPPARRPPSLRLQSCLYERSAR